MSEEITKDAPVSTDTAKVSGQPEIKKGLPSTMSGEDAQVLRDSMMEGRDENFNIIDPDKGNDGKDKEGSSSTSTKKAESEESSANAEQPSSDTASDDAVEFDFSTLKGEDKTNAENWQKSLTEKSQALANEKKEFEALLSKHGDDVKLGLEKEREEFEAEKSRYDFEGLRTIVGDQGSVELLKEVVELYNEDHPDSKIEGNPFDNLLNPEMSEKEKQLMEEQAKLTVDREEMELSKLDSKYAKDEKKVAKLWQYAIDNKLPDLKSAYKLESYDNMTNELKDARNEVKELKARLNKDAVPTLGTKSITPQSEKIDVTKLTPQQRSERAKEQYNNLILNKR